MQRFEPTKYVSSGVHKSKNQSKKGEVCFLQVCQEMGCAEAEWELKVSRGPRPL